MSVHVCACLAASDQVHILYGAFVTPASEQTHASGGSDTSVLTLGFPGPLSGGTQSAESKPSSPVSPSQAGPKLFWMHQQRSADFFWMSKGQLEACGL